MAISNALLGAEKHLSLIAIKRGSRPYSILFRKGRAEPIWFMTIDQTGYVELAFVLPSVARRSVGRALLNAAEQWVADHGATRLTAEASLVAHPFFLKGGWIAVEDEHVERKGVVLKRYRMQKDPVQLAPKFGIGCRTTFCADYSGTTAWRNKGVR